MKEFTCSYRSAAGKKSDAQPKEKVKAASAEEAAKIYAERFPSEDPHIDVVSFVSGRTRLNNPGPTIRAEKESQTRYTTLANIYSRIESGGGEFNALTYEEMNALIKNLKEYPSLRGKIDGEETVVREALFMRASFDGNLQTLLQADLLRDVKSSCEDLLALLAAHTKSSKGSNNTALLGAAAGLAVLGDIRENTE